MEPEIKTLSHQSIFPGAYMFSTFNNGYNQHNTPYLSDPRKFNDRWYDFRDKQLIDWYRNEWFFIPDNDPNALFLKDVPVVDKINNATGTDYYFRDRMINNASEEDLIQGSRNHRKHRLNTVKIYNKDNFKENPELIKYLSRSAKRDGYGSGDLAIKKLINDYYGLYYYPVHSIILNTTDPSTLVHELHHSLGNKMNPYGTNTEVLPHVETEFLKFKKNMLKSYNWYLDDPAEIAARLMQFRWKNKINPLHEYTIEEVKNMRKDPKIKDYDLLKRYDDEMMLMLLNKIAQTTPKNNNPYTSVV